MNSAPIAVPDGAQFGEYVFANQSGSRAYKLYVPSTYHGQTLPLVVMLHGCTQSPDDFAAGTRMNDAGRGEHGCLVAYPAQAAVGQHLQVLELVQGGGPAARRGEPSLIAGITRQIMRDFRSTHGASMSPGSRPVVPQPRSWERLIQTFMRRSASTPAWRVALPATCLLLSQPCGKAGPILREHRAGLDAPSRPLYFTETAIPPSTP